MRPTRPYLKGNTGVRLRPQIYTFFLLMVTVHDKKD